MPIDNYQTAIALTNKLKQNLPLYAFILPEPAKMLRLEHNIEISSKERLTIEDLHYAEDPGGIICSLGAVNAENVLVMSITHLKFPDDCPFLEEIIDYQETRIINLMIQDGHIGQAKRKLQQKQKRQNSRKGFGS